VGRSEVGSVARCQTTLLFLSTLKLAKNLAFASWIICSLCSSNWSCSSAGKVSQVGSMMLLGETSELSLEPAIEGRFDRSKYVVPSAVAKKYVDAFSERQIPKKNQRRCSLVRHGRSAAWGRTVRDLAQGSGLLPDDRTVRALGAGRSARTQRRRMSPAAAWISLPGGTPSGRRDPRGCLGSGRPT
jgi:hypothetical protein